MDALWKQMELRGLARLGMPTCLMRQMVHCAGDQILLSYKNRRQTDKQTEQTDLRLDDPTWNPTLKQLQQFLNNCDSTPTFNSNQWGLSTRHARRQRGYRKTQHKRPKLQNLKKAGANDIFCCLCLWLTEFGLNHYTQIHKGRLAKKSRRCSFVLV